MDERPLAVAIGDDESAAPASVGVGDGAPLLTSRVATPQGRVFEYVIENASAPTDDEVVELLREELEAEVAALEERRDRDPIIPKSLPPPSGKRGFGVSLELISLVGFPPNVELYCEYEVHLPPGWQASACSACRWIAAGMPRICAQPWAGSRGR